MSVFSAISGRMWLGGLLLLAWVSDARPADKAAFQQKDAQRPPNIIVVLADDLGWSELGCYGNTFNQTPNLDRLAAGGMKFTQAYAAAPVCTPTRAALMTGQHPARVGLTDFLDVHDEKFLSPSYITINERLKEGGYHTGLIGKWHLTGDYEKKRGEPAKHGWDEVIASETAYIANGDYFHPYFPLPGLPARQQNEYLVDRLNQEAVDFVQRNKAQPFFLYLAHYAVHTKLAGKPQKVQKYQAKPGAGAKQNNPELAAMLESMDEGVGMLLATLQQEGLLNNTLIVFTSDNGGETNVTSNAPLRAGKSTLYEGGIREPFIVYWPGKVKAGTTSQVPITTVDMYPTLLEVAARPALTNADGRSLVPQFRGVTAASDRALYWHYPLPKPHFLGGRSAGAIRQGDYKLIEFFDDGSTELYNLKNDLSETQNLATKQSAQAAQLLKQLRQWRASLPSTASTTR